jgi:predicted TIM-barrel fold metal-dependent hydrolase
MRVNDLILVSVDDHLVEPPGMFDTHIPAKYRDRAPRVERDESGSDVWVFEGQVISNPAMNSLAGRPKEEYGIEPTAYDEMRPGCYDVHERIKDMNAGGVLGSMCFPTFPGYAGRLFGAVDDKDLALDVLRAYNDWHIDEWCGAYPDRFIPLTLPVLWDPEAAAAEIHRVAAKGARAVTFTENPVALGYPSFHSEHWDPLWKAICDEDMVMAIHFGSGGVLVQTSPDAPVDVNIVLMGMNMSHVATEVLWSPFLQKFPIKIALSEGGTGWIAYFLDRVDKVYDTHHTWTKNEFGGKHPSEVFKEHFLTCFVTDPVGVQHRHDIGIDSMAWECDYPHPDSVWPNAPEDFATCVDGVPDDEVMKLGVENAMRWFRFDPFVTRTREQATVGALRAEAAGHDVSVRSFDKGRFEHKIPALISEMAKVAPA